MQSTMHIVDYQRIVFREYTGLVICGKEIFKYNVYIKVWISYSLIYSWQNMHCLKNLQCGAMHAICSIKCEFQISPSWRYIHVVKKRSSLGHLLGHCEASTMHHPIRNHLIIFWMHMLNICFIFWKFIEASNEILGC